MAGWCTIESDPGVFSELIQKFGVSGVQVEELYSVDDESLKPLDPIYGLIFLFKYDKRLYEGEDAEVDDVDGLYFARQTVNNACATQAILNILLNLGDQVDLGKDLSGFHNFTSELNAQMRGDAIGSNAMLREVHNSFGRSDPFSFEDGESSSDEAYHFVAYVPRHGLVYELDGLRNGPVIVGGYEDDWVSAAKPSIERKMSILSEGEIRFNLLAVCGDLKEKYETLLMSFADPTCEEAKEMQAKLEMEKQKREMWHVENVRRKHNYVPLVFEVLKQLAQKGKLDGLIDEGVKKAKERQEKQKQEDKKA
mmetsp:Transcript_23184/g.58766  ORF Transcript_23184/g.58766 Transcript_23184/m.58766 type:complete len:309 (-) Transcript_23184:306-1232(-)